MVSVLHCAAVGVKNELEFGAVAKADTDITTFECPFRILASLVVFNARTTATYGHAGVRTVPAPIEVVRHRGCRSLRVTSAKSYW